MIEWLLHPATLAFGLHLAIIVGLTLRVIGSQPPTGVALSWLMLIAIFPYFGGLVYLLVGERRISQRRAKLLEQMRLGLPEMLAKAIPPLAKQNPPQPHRPQLIALQRLAQRLSGTPVLGGNRLALDGATHRVLERIAADIDAAERSLLMEFYIWNAGGLADHVLEAVKRAAARGVACRLLIDDLGAIEWWRGPQPASLRAAGVQLRPALPLGLGRTVWGRADLRLHRKIVVIDGRIGWTGSMNMVDPAFFKQSAGVGQWVDAMVRVEGLALAPLTATFLADWTLESSEPLGDITSQLRLEPVVPVGEAEMQVVPSGPGLSGDGLLQLILSAMYAAEQQLVLTTPYLIPDDCMIQALRTAAGRGVRVQVIVPERVDSVLTRHASRSYFEQLLSAGVEIHLYRGGLLHTKSLRVDDDLSLFGTANFDLRSLWLNYEVTLLIYDRTFNAALARLQDDYLLDCHRLELEAWRGRSQAQRLIQNSLRLASPLL